MKCRKRHAMLLSLGILALTGFTGPVPTRPAAATAIAYGSIQTCPSYCLNNWTKFCRRICNVTSG